MSQTLTLREIAPVTHDTRRLTFERPADFQFRPGQAIDLAIDKDGWREEQRPFTMASLPTSDRLEFVIKSYPSHDGVTEQIGMMQPGDAVIIGEPWGAIEDRGPGTIIAGGAGITPFIAILRARQAEAGALEGYRLIFSNKRERDIILREELEAMPGLTLDLLVSDEDPTGLTHARLDADTIDTLIEDFSGIFYLCGPPAMEEDVARTLTARGVTQNRLVREDN